MVSIYTVPKASNSIMFILLKPIKATLEVEEVWRDCRFSLGYISSFNHLTCIFSGGDTGRIAAYRETKYGNGSAKKQV